MGISRLWKHSREAIDPTVPQKDLSHFVGLLARLNTEASSIRLPDDKVLNILQATAIPPEPPRKLRAPAAKWGAISSGRSASYCFFYFN